MTNDKFTQNNDNPLKRIDWFGVCYWAAAGVQVVGSFNVFGTVGGSWLHAVAGALCLELLILALNAYGVKQFGRWMGLVCMASLALIAASAMFQVADLLSHKTDADLAARLGVVYYGILRATVPVVPSVAMAVVTLIKFVDARRNQGVPLVVQLEATARELRQTQATLGTVANQADDAIKANAQLGTQVDTLHAQLETQQVAHSHELREVARLATAQRVTQPAQPLQLADGGMTWEAALQHLAECNETPGATRMAQLTGFNKSTTSRRLAKGAK